MTSASGLTDLAAIGSIASGLLLPALAFLVVVAKRWIKQEVVSNLKNGETSAAKYAHDARDYAKQALDATHQGNQILIDHVTNRELHRVR